MTRKRGRTPVVEVGVPERVQNLHLLDRVDYEDGYEVESVESRTPRWWMTAFIEKAPLWFIVPWYGVGRFGFGGQFGPLHSSPDHVRGWKVITDEPDVCVVALDATTGLSVRLAATVENERTTVSTQLRIDSRYVQRAWPAIRRGHRYFAPLLLARANEALLHEALS